MNWKHDVEYVFYVPELDFIYTATVISKKPTVKTLRRCPDFIDKGNPVEVYLNPNVLLLMNWLTGKITTHETVLVGVV